MTLLEHLHRLNRLRTEGLPPYLKNICLIASSARLPEVPGLLEGHPQIRPRIIALLDEESSTKRHNMTLHGREEHIPLVGVDMLPAYPNLDFVFYPHSEESFHSTFWILHRRLTSYGTA